MRDFIITEGQLKSLIETIETSANDVTITGGYLTAKTGGTFGSTFYLKKPVVIGGGAGNLTSNDLSQLYGNKGYLEIKMDDQVISFDMGDCRGMLMTKFGDLQIPARCVGFDNPNREAVDKILSKQER